MVALSRAGIRSHEKVPAPFRNLLAQSRRTGRAEHSRWTDRFEILPARQSEHSRRRRQKLARTQRRWTGHSRLHWFEMGFRPVSTEERMKTLAAILIISAATVSGAEPLVLKAAIPLPGVKGRFDHFAIDTNTHRLFVA